MYITRELSDKLEDIAAKFPIVVLTGARQTGKTTLLKHLFPKHKYVSLDLPSLAEKAEKDPLGFLTEYPPPIVIDEVQYAPGLFRHLKMMADLDRHTGGQFILTGSQKFNVMKEVSDSLSGRCVWYTLEPLSFSEISSAFPEMNSLENVIELLIRGGFPDLWRDQTIPLVDFFRSYVATYIERDVRQILNITHLRDFERFVRACAFRNGQLLNKSEIARDAGITPKTANEWLSILEASNVIVLLEPYFSNLGKGIVKSPKLYFCDTGLLCFLLGIPKEILGGSAFIGSLWETFIFGELRKISLFLGIPAQIYFYRDHLNREIDFLVASGEKLKFLECKWTQYPDERDIKIVSEISEFLTKKQKIPPKISSYMIARTETSYPKSSQFQVISGLKLGEIFRS